MRSSTKVSTAYILIIHKNSNQVNKFIKQLIDLENADVYVHIDKKSYSKLHDTIIKDAKVTILEECVDVVWGDITQIDATILLLRKVIESGKSYDFVCLRSGQDLLVKSGLKDFLLKNKNKIFMTANKIERKESQASYVFVRWPKLARRLYLNPFHIIRLFRRAVSVLYRFGVNLFPNKYRFPENFSIYFGSQWFSIPLIISQFIIEFIDTNTWYYEFFRDSLVPDQIFFQTLIMNSKYKSDVCNENLMYLKFGDTLKSRNNPIIFKMQDIEEILNSNEFFARKFDENVDCQVVDYFVKEVKM